MSVVSLNFCISTNPPVNCFVFSGKKNAKVPRTPPTALPTVNPLAAPTPTVNGANGPPANPRSAPSPANTPPTAKLVAFTKPVNNANCPNALANDVMNA